MVVSASVDQLLHRLLVYDFSPNTSSAVSKLVRSMTPPVLGKHDAKVLKSKAKYFKVNMNKTTQVRAKVADAAQKVSQERQQQQSAKSLIRQCCEEDAKERGEPRKWLYIPRRCW